MSDRLVPVIKERVNKGLEVAGISQRKLAAMIGVNYRHMNASINNGRIGAWTLNEIGKIIDRAPEYLSGMTDGGIADGLVLKYSFHEAQDKSMNQRMTETIEGLIYFSFIDFKDEMTDLSGEQKKEMLWRAVHAADAYYIEITSGRRSL